jgi:DNA-binding transcriptional LysR family regulator
MNLIGALRVFARVAETSGFSTVAREMNVTQSAISRQVLQLEGHFGVRLLHRTTRRTSLTEDGRDLLDHARRLLELAEDMESTLGQHRNLPIGVVRLGTTVAFGLFLAPRLSGLFARYPGLSVELILGDHFGDLIEERLDIATRSGEVADSSLISRPLGTYHRIIVAAPEYLERCGCPAKPTDLRQHDCIVHLHAHGGREWQFTGPHGAQSVHVGGSLAVNNSEAAHLAVLAGQGIALMPEIQVVEDIRSGRLRRVLTAYPSEPRRAYIVYPSRRHLAPRTRVVIDFLIEQARLLQQDQHDLPDELMAEGRANGTPFLYLPRQVRPAGLTGSGFTALP